ncbi:ParB/RepB/Spo0J family partition protein [Hydrogenophaga borbori]|uniref:ParB/RepB/Spo0J family partition protein n=1 Tax=Hydrogenophaga borbori TaxID=2294117 RepID=UPI00301E5582
MSRAIEGKEVRVIPIARIAVMNPRERNPVVFAEIVQSIRSVGLKKPITVTAAVGEDGAECFKLVCGEGRLKAVSQLGDTQIAAIVIEVSEEDAYIMSLAENLARRRYRPIELLTGIRLLHAKGYSISEISRKTGLSREYVKDLVLLISQGEDRILSAVESGLLPIRAAVDIVEAGDDDAALQATMHEAYESGALRGRQLLEVRRLLKQRDLFGKSCARRGSSGRESPVTTRSLVRTYQQEVDRQRMVVRKGTHVQERLLIVISALRKLLADENFVTLLRAEGLETLPKYLADRIHALPTGSRK